MTDTLDDLLYYTKKKKRKKKKKYFQCERVLRTDLKIII